MLASVSAESFRYLETTSASTASTCVVNGYYDCSLCACDLTEPDPVLTITLCVISILFSLFLVYGFFTTQELRDKPGDILFAISIADILYAAGRIFATLTYTNKDTVTDASGSVCTASSAINMVAIGLTRCYHLAFFVYYRSVLKTSLKGGGIPKLVYHIGSMVITGLFVWYILAQGYLGRSIFGICVLKTSPGYVTTILTNGILLAFIYWMAILTKSYVPENEKVSDVRAQFVRFILRYLIAISILYIARGIIDTITSILVQDIVNNAVDTTLASHLNTMKILTEISTGITPLVLNIARLSDPNMRVFFTKLFRRNDKDVQNQSNNLEDPLKRASIKEFELSVQRSSLVNQFRQSRRVEVLYSLLSGIHYFWHVKKMNKMIELEPLKFSPDENDPNEDYIKESKNRRTLFVQEDTLTNQVPELFEEIKEKHYSLAKGTLIAYAPRLFEEIIELDDIGRGIRKSLDLKQNFSRILKSGINGGGKSGEFFFFSDDNRFIIKTIGEAELDVFKEILPGYAKYLKLNPNSIIAKIYGVFTFEVAEPPERYNLILMRNINGYPSDCVDRKYDVKGSTVGRIVVKDPSVTMAELKHLGVLKDLDFDRFEQTIHMDAGGSKELYKQLQSDIRFLSSQGLVDYSLAVYVINRKKFELSNGGKSQEEEASKRVSTGKSGESYVAFKSTKEDKYYHIGIIDYLIQFNLRKKSEVFFKKLKSFNPNLDISVQKPMYYGERFLKYMEKILPESQSK